MSNEELVLEIQKGKSEYIPILWQQIIKFIEFQADKFLSTFPEHLQEFRNDMVNESYFQFLIAVEKYDPKGGSFINYLSWYIKKPFHDVIVGNNSAEINDPIKYSISIDRKLSDDDALTISEILKDESAEKEINTLENIEFWQNVNHLLSSTIKQVLKEKEQIIFQYMLDHGCSYSEALLNFPEYVAGARSYQNCKARIRNHLRRKTIKSEMKNIGLDDFIWGWGVKAWRRNKFTSSTESCALKRLISDGF